MRILLLILNIFFVRTIYASPATYAYLCKTKQGEIGYFDVPCNYINNFSAKTFGKDQIINQTIISLINLNKKIIILKLPKEATANLPEKARLKPNKLPKKEKKIKPTTIHNKLCIRAITKISAIQKLLETKQLDQLTIKLQHDLAKYKLMEKKYCKLITMNDH